MSEEANTRTQLLLPSVNVWGRFQACRSNLAMDDYATVAALGSWPYLKSRVTAVMKGPKQRADMARKMEKKRTSRIAAEKDGKRKARKTASIDAQGAMDRGQGTLCIPRKLLDTGKIVVIDGSGGWLSAWYVRTSRPAVEPRSLAFCLPARLSTAPTSCARVRNRQVCVKMLSVCH
jgi:hypothetical protein